ncbi:MAG: hypothetical protein Q9221_007874 [Calogaya cf. arnoldii]
MITTYISERNAGNLTQERIETLLGALSILLANETSAESWTEAINRFVDDIEAEGVDHVLEWQIEPVVKEMSLKRQLELESQPIWGKKFKLALARLTRERIVEFQPQRGKGCGGEVGGRGDGRRGEDMEGDEGRSDGG